MFALGEAFLTAILVGETPSPSVEMGRGTRSNKKQKPAEAASAGPSVKEASGMRVYLLLLSLG